MTIIPYSEVIERQYGSAITNIFEALNAIEKYNGHSINLPAYDGRNYGFASTKLEDITCKSLAFSMIDECKMEYINQNEKDIEDFKSDSGIRYLIYIEEDADSNEIRTAEIGLGYHSKFIEGFSTKIPLIDNEWHKNCCLDIDKIVEELKRIYKEYTEKDKEYREKLTKKDIQAFRKLKTPSQRIKIFINKCLRERSDNS